MITKIGIDAHNIRAGGGLTHLKEILKFYDKNIHFDKIIVIWATKKTLEQLPENAFLVKKTNFFINFSTITRIFWHRYLLSYDLKKNNCDVLFVPGSMFITKFKPVITLSQNMLPFEEKERKRYGFSYMYLKLLILFYLQKRSFKKANGVIFLTSYAKKYIESKTKLNFKNNVIIPHGISDSFFKKQEFYNRNYNLINPFKIIYVSILDVYKHQDIIAEAIIDLHKENIWVSIDFWGSAYKPAKKKLDKIINNYKYSDLLNYKGIAHHDNLQNIISTYDLFIFGSTCENMPNILLEGMAMSMPIACSNFGPMPEILKDGGLYFNPLDKNEIKNTIKMYYNSVSLRNINSLISYKLAKNYSWYDCSKNTFDYIMEIKENYDK